ncbi:MAG: NeuD/PglB/VioB family sugar acetyltransferase [Gaiellales bacterium]
MSEIGILGAGRQAHETAGYYRERGWDVRFFVANPEFLERARADAALGAPVLSAGEAHAAHSDVAVIAALGYAGLRRALVRSWPGSSFHTYVSDRAWLAPDVEVREGVTVCPGALINRWARIGRHALVNIGASISHDSRVGEFATIGPGARIAGRVTVGPGSFVGIGATVSDGIAIGAGCVVGAGAAVVDDVPDGAVVAGVPARVIRTLSKWP